MNGEQLFYLGTLVAGPLVGLGVILLFRSWMRPGDDSDAYYGFFLLQCLLGGWAVLGMLGTMVVGISKIDALLAGVWFSGWCAAGWMDAFSGFPVSRQLPFVQKLRRWVARKRLSRELAKSQNNKEPFFPGHGALICEAVELPLNQNMIRATFDRRGDDYSRQLYRAARIAAPGVFPRLLTRVIDHRPDWVPEIVEHRRQEGLETPVKKRHLQALVFHENPNVREIGVRLSQQFG